MTFGNTTQLTAVFLKVFVACFLGSISFVAAAAGPPQVFAAPPRAQIQPYEFNRFSSPHAQLRVARLQHQLERAQREMRLQEREHARLRNRLWQMNSRMSRLDRAHRQDLVARHYFQQQLANATNRYDRAWRHAENRHRQLNRSGDQHQYIARLRNEQRDLRRALAERDNRIATLTQQVEKRLPAMTSIARLTPAVDIADRDDDGVADAQDLCPDAPTATGTAGCNTDTPVTMEGVNFRYDSYELTDESRQVLARVAGVLKQHPDVKLEVAGHTDAQGNPAYNVWLSQKRAEAVREYLLTEGIASGNLLAKGYGGEQPIADNDTLEGLRSNRRVELHWLL
jgi:outer membrane protein OmpA-like peptidoglycan-associated protein